MDDSQAHILPPKWNEIGILSFKVYNEDVTMAKNVKETMKSRVNDDLQ